MRSVLILAALAAEAVYGQNIDLAFNAVTTTGISAVMLGGSVNQFHQLTVIATDITTSSCSGGWSGVIYLRASQDKTNWTQLGLSITAVADNAIQYTSASGSFNYIDVDYVSGSTSTCKLTAWYSGTTTGYPSSSIAPAPPVQIAGNGAVYNGGQAVTATAAALPSQVSKQACVKASIANVINVYVGTGTVTATGSTVGYELAPDEAVCLPVANVALIYVIASTTGASVSWVATN